MTRAGVCTEKFGSALNSTDKAKSDRAANDGNTKYENKIHLQIANKRERQRKKEKAEKDKQRKSEGEVLCESYERG